MILYMGRPVFGPWARHISTLDFGMKM